MSDSKDEEPGIVIGKTSPALTPPGYKIQLSVAQAVAVAEFVDSPTFKMLEKIYVAQRKDHIARVNLNASQSMEQLGYYRGMAAELSMFFKNMRAVKASLEEAKPKKKK